jgi:DNA-directed RNA polymerase specialized sigma24 family protein
MARSLDRDAVETLLRAFYPQIYRIAMALCGRATSAKLVVTTVMQQSIKTIPWWHNETEASNWFLHHTVLNCREFTGTPPDPSEDCLILSVKTPTPEHIAFVKALRDLPPQQCEAFLLLRAEKLDPRRVAVAMDCSTGAAANHLIAATKSLTAIAAGSFDQRADELVKIYMSLVPPHERMQSETTQIADQLRKFKPRKKVFRKIFLTIALIIIAWIIWRLSTMIVT